MSEAIGELKKATENREYLFHGSPTKLDLLEPRQAHSHSRSHGKMAVFATSYYQIAIFRALTLAAKLVVKPSEYQSAFSLDDGRLLFRVSKATLNAIKTGLIGYVYLLDKGQFELINSMEYRAVKAVSPVKTLQVEADDLPDVKEF